MTAPFAGTIAGDLTVASDRRLPQILGRLVHGGLPAREGLGSAVEEAHPSALSQRARPRERCPSPGGAKEPGTSPSRTVEATATSAVKTAAATITATGSTTPVFGHGKLGSG